MAWIRVVELDGAVFPLSAVRFARKSRDGEDPFLEINFGAETLRFFPGTGTPEDRIIVSQWYGEIKAALKSP